MAGYPHDTVGLEAEVKRVAAMGFSGKASYHPTQIPIIHAAFTPTAEAIAEARAVLDAAGRDAVGLTRVGGFVVNAASVKSAERILAIARRRGVG